MCTLLSAEPPGRNSVTGLVSTPLGAAALLKDKDCGAHDTFTEYIHIYIHVNSPCIQRKTGKQARVIVSFAVHDFFEVLECRII